MMITTEEIATAKANHDAIFSRTAFYLRVSHCVPDDRELDYGAVLDYEIAIRKALKKALLTEGHSAGPEFFKAVEVMAKRVMPAFARGRYRTWASGIDCSYQALMDTIEDTDALQDERRALDNAPDYQIYATTPNTFALTVADVKTIRSLL